MARHRSPSGAQEDDPERTTRLRAVHRLPAPPAASARGRATVAAVAAGAVVAAGQTLLAPFLPDGSPQPVSALQPVAQTTTETPDPLVRAIGGDQLPPNVLSLANRLDPASEVDVKSLAKATDIGAKLARNAALVEAAEASGADEAHVIGNFAFVRPALGAFTSGFGARWGVTHYGIDLAAPIGTPIFAFTDGVVEESGPASGFGMWVVLRHADGTRSVYGHINRSLVSVGQTVSAGEEIAEVGNRGQSTGPHLHFEIWDAAKNKMNPLPILQAMGLRVVGDGANSPD